jgi:hypothetical protein
VAPNNENIPEFKIPSPEAEKTAAGTLYYYPIPEEAGLDKQVQPTFGLGKKVGVFALSKKHAERLLAETPLKVKSGPLARKGNLVGVCVVNWPAFVDAVRPWLEFVVPMSMIASAGSAEDDPNAKQKLKEAADLIVKQMRPVFPILKVFKGATWVSYVEGDALVTHGQMVLKDLPKAE